MAILTHSFAAETIRLWPGDAPGAVGKSEHDIPTMMAYFANPKKATGAALVICPGGSYGALASHEGKDYALWLNELGISAFVLSYRLGSHGYRHPVMLGDVARAVRTVRSRAASWKLNPERIGVMGSSAGGHLAATLLTQFDAGNPKSTDPIERISSRPDLGILCYPVISMSSELTHLGSRDNLLGPNPISEQVIQLSNELQVRPTTPPVFLWSTADDGAVKVENSLAFAGALRKNRVSFALHVYPKGRHGLGLGAPAGDRKDHLPWVGQCENWLAEMGFARRSPDVLPTAPKEAAASPR